MKKYELTGKTNSKGLRRIRALRSFEGVAEGDIGGWIESEANLSHDGNCWVFHEAQVYESAEVAEDAQVFGKARAFGGAAVFGSARVFQNARIYGGAGAYGSAWVYGRAQVFGRARAYGSAQIYGDAQVYDGAEVCWQARVYKVARVYGAAMLRVGHFTRPGISRNPRVIVGTRNLVCESSDGYIQIGCKCLHISEWLDSYRAIGAAEGYTDSEIEEYGEYLNIFARWYGVEVV